MTKENLNCLTVNEDDVFHYSTHAELLNFLLKRDLKAWMKAAFVLNQNDVIWMVRLDNSPRNGWKNRRVGDIIYENFINGIIPIDPHDYKNRLCFSIHGSGNYRYYIFEGLYSCIKTENNTRIYKKIQSSYSF